MTEGVSSSEDAAAARAAEQVRQRKLRREAKIRAGGASRLDKITGLSGGLPKGEPPAQPRSFDEQATSNPATPSGGDADPEEVDISRHFYTPQATARPPQNDASNLSEAQLRQMMLGFDRSSAGSGTSTPLSGNRLTNNTPPLPGMEGMDQDPMMQMLQKMMAGGMPGMGGATGNNPFAGAGLDGLFGQGGGPNAMQQGQQSEQTKNANLWRILHAVFALGLGLYVALSTTFTGSRLEREADDLQSTGMLGAQNIEQARMWFFYVFSSVETVLLTSRFLMERSTGFMPSGWMWTATGFIPEPFQGYSRHALRYSQIFTTVRNDALFCVFVMGLCCLLRS
ncbi:hypothetical protein GGR50DRAFT_688444 [Xylaria sp. CBS 124048]|nr:hypothetical protein GGR50DRAFT_688444 [Xylaria sp. CBS 124048]